MTREGLRSLFLQHHFLCFPPPDPSAHGCQHPANARRAITVPRPRAQAGPQGQPQSLTCPESQPAGGWGGDITGGAWGAVRGEAGPTPGYWPSARHGSFLSREKLLPWRWAVGALWAMEIFPHRQRSFPCEPLLALREAAPSPCQQHFKLWPAQCYILTGQALLA